MGRRHREMEQRRRPVAASRAGRGRQSGLARYLTDVVAIALIALALNFLLYELGMLNGLLRILIGLVVGRVVVTAVRRTVEGRR